MAWQARGTSLLMSRAAQTKAAALPHAGWRAERVRAVYAWLSALLGGPPAAGLPDCSIAQTCVFQVFASFLFGILAPLAWSYFSERRAKRQILAAAAALSGGSRSSLSVGAGGSGALLRHLAWAPLAGWAGLVLLWRIAGAYTRAQGDTVACPPGFA